MIVTGIVFLVLIFLVLSPSTPVTGSDPGKIWKKATDSAAFGPRCDASALEFDNKLWVIGGDNGQLMRDVWYSGDGITWKQATPWAEFPARRSPSAVVFNNTMWIIGGMSDDITAIFPGADVWSSSDGKNWTMIIPYAGFIPRKGHSSVVFDNKIWVLGGKEGNVMMNDVWYSSNGVNWTRATEHAEFAPRYSHATLVYDNKMWIIGGENLPNVLDDVWYSSNGINWTLATEHTEFGKRQAFGSAVFDNKMWVIAGFDTNQQDPGVKNDVWYSVDGKIWIRSTSHSALSSRTHTMVLPYNGKMWLLGGIGDVSGRMIDPAKDYKSDVWFTEKK